MMENAPTNFGIGDFEDTKSSNQGDDYYECIVKKPRHETPFGEDDLDFMSLLPDPSGEAQLYETVQKVMKERVRRNTLMSSQNPDLAAVKDTD